MSTGNDYWWKQAGDMRGWVLPERAPAWLRRPVVRHLRWAYLAYQQSRWDAAWRSMGLFPTGYDQWVLYAIWRGWV